MLVSVLLVEIFISNVGGTMAKYKIKNMTIDIPDEDDSVRLIADELLKLGGVYDEDFDILTNLAVLLQYHLNVQLGFDPEEVEEISQ